MTAEGVRKIILQTSRGHPSTSWNFMPFTIRSNELNRLVAALGLRERQGLAHNHAKS